MLQLTIKMVLLQLWHHSNNVHKTSGWWNGDYCAITSY